jgi:hypothetical protein
VIADALCAQGRYDEAKTETDVVPAGVTDWLRPHVRWRAARAKALARVGPQHEAVALAREAAALAEPTDALNMRADALFDQADVLAACDRDEEAARSLETALALYERKGNAVMAARTKGLLESEATFATNPPISHVESLNRGTSEPPRIPDLG